MAKKPKVCIIGAESWGSAISTAVCKNVLNGGFDERVHIYVYDELIRSNYLSEVMNERHENIKYLPGIKLDKNLIAVNDLLEAAKEADILIFASSYSFIKPYCNILAGKVKSDAYAVSLIKGFDHIRDGEIDLYSHSISSQLNIPCYSVMSANSAMEMAQGKLCEITIGCNNETHAHQLANLFQTENCKVFSIDDVDGVELCNTLKDLIALSAGFIDGLRLGDNARVACLHLGLKEMMRFINAFNPTTKLSTFFESCGVANSVASSYADKNATLAKTLVTSRKTVQEIEANLLNGRKLLGPVIAGEIFDFLERKKLQHKYPLFTILHQICQNELPPEALVDTLRKHPDLSNYSIPRLQKEEYSMPISDTEGVLENLANIVPESPSLIDSKSKNANGFNEKEALLEENNKYFKIPNDNMELIEFLDKCQISGMKAVAAVDVSKPNDGNVEYSFEIGSVDDKPEIYLKLKDITKNSIKEAIGSSTELDKASSLMPNQDRNHKLINAVGSSNLSSEFQFPKDVASSKFLSIKGFPAELSGSETSKSDEGKPSPIVGLTNLIERHVGPYNDTFKALKVRVKVQNDDKKSNDKKGHVKSTLNKNKSSSTNMHVRKADSKFISKSVDIVDTEPYEEIPGNKVTKSRVKEQILYDKDSTYGMRILDDEPNVMRLVDMIRIKQNKFLEEEFIEHSINVNPQLKDIKNESANEENMMDQAHRNVFPINQGGYTVDYLKIVRPKKKPDITSLQGNDESFTPTTHKPLQYSKTDNSYRPIKADPEIQNYSQDELRLIKAKQSKQIDQPQMISLKDMNNLITTSALEPTVLESSSKKSSKMLHYDDQENKEGSQKETLLSLRGNDTDKHNVEDPKELKTEQEFLDDHLHEKASSSVIFNNDSSKRMHYENQFTVSEAKKDFKLPCSKLEDPNFWLLNKEKTRHRLEYFNEAEKKHTILEREEPTTFQHSKNDLSKRNHSVNENKEPIDGKSNINKDQDLLAFEQDSHLENIHTLELENPILEGKSIESNNWKNLQDNEEVLAQASNDWKDGNTKQVEHSIEKDHHQLLTFEKLEKNEESLNYDKPEVVENHSKDFDKLLLNNEELCGDDGIDEQSKLIDGQRSLAFVKKSQVHSPEDSNLHFYHGKHDGEQGPELDCDECDEDLKKRSKRKIFLGADNTNNSQAQDSVGHNYQPIYDQEKNGIRKLFKKKSISIKRSAPIEEEDISQDQHQLSSASLPPPKPPLSMYSQQRKPEAMPTQFRRKDISDLTLQESNSTAFCDSELAEEPIESDQILSESFPEESEVIPQEDFLNKTFKTPTSDPILSEFSAEETDAILHEDLVNTMVHTPTPKPTVSELNTEEMLREDEQFKEILGCKETKNSFLTETEYIEEPIYSNSTEALKEDTKKDDLKLENEEELCKQLNTLMTKGQTKERKVKYKGENPYIWEPNKFSYQGSDSTELETSQKNEHKMKEKKAVVRPSFYPPINPRVRIPRPPFDVRDHEYHTVTYRPPPDLMRHTTLPLRRVPSPYQIKQVAAASSVVNLPRPVMRLPSSVMRSSVLAVEVGLFAAFFTRYKGGYK